jgi:hypothetical protein
MSATGHSKFQSSNLSDNSSPKKHTRMERSGTLSNPTLQSNQHANDIARMGEEGFDCETYVRSMLQKLPNEEAVQQLQRTLADAKDDISFDLQRNVYKNYNEFVVISKEISKLEGDMISVRRVLSELKEVRDKFGEYTYDGK